MIEEDLIVGALVHYITDTLWQEDVVHSRQKQLPCNRMCFKCKLLCCKLLNCAIFRHGEFE